MPKPLGSQPEIMPEPTALLEFCWQWPMFWGIVGGFLMGCAATIFAASYLNRKNR